MQKHYFFQTSRGQLVVKAESLPNALEICQATYPLLLPEIKDTPAYVVAFDDQGRIISESWEPSNNGDDIPRI